MRLFIKLILLLILSPFLSIAQSFYQPGTIVTLKGDSLHEFINYSEWQINPRSISFKTDSSNSPVKYSAKDIRYFNVSVGHLAEYIRYQGVLSTDNIDPDHLFIGRDTGKIQDTVFLKIVQKGKHMVLLSYSDNLKTRFFIAENITSTPTELVYRIYYNDEHTTVHENTYMYQLYQVGVKSGVMTPSLKNRIEKSNYKELDILDIAGKINNISNTDIAQNNPTDAKPINKALIVIGGIAFVTAVIVMFANIHN